MSDKCCTPFIEGEGCNSVLQKKASNVASGDFSTAVGHGTIASNEGELSAGKYNQPNAGQVFSVGIGTSDSNRKNALQVSSDGTTSVLYNGQLVPLGEFITYINETSGNRIRMGIVDGCIKVSYDSGQTWETVIALSELQGAPGQPGAGVRRHDLRRIQPPRGHRGERVQGQARDQHAQRLRVGGQPAPGVHPSADAGGMPGIHRRR